jgi:hypothetical protein
MAGTVFNDVQLGGGHDEILDEILDGMDGGGGDCDGGDGGSES